MCRKGNDMVRGLLWQCAKCASAVNGGNPAVRALYLRRLAAGDSAQVAWGYCMTKLLRQVYGVWSSNTPFDPQYEANKRLASNQQTAAPESPSEKAETSGPKLDTHNESACEEVTDVSASQEPVTAAPPPVVESPIAPPPAVASPFAALPETHETKSSSRPPIDFKILRDMVPLQQV